MATTKHKSEIHRPRILVSACLMGQNVRYDGKRLEASICNALEDRFELVATCPEVDAGMQVPRPPIQLEGERLRPELIRIADGKNFTKKILQSINRFLEQIGTLDGAILKARSPSCGSGHAKLYSSESGEMIDDRASGLLPLALRHKFPDIPIIDEDDFADVDQRELFMAKAAADCDK